MLRRCTLENFKPIRGRLDLPLAPLTLLAGLNSSGKSTVLQSILLASQTLGNQNLDRPLILNGNVVRLGTFDTLLNARAESPSLSLGMDILFDAPPAWTTPQRSQRLFYRYSSLDDTIRNVRVFATFTATDPSQHDGSAIAAVRATLDSADLEVTLDRTSARARTLPHSDSLLSTATPTSTVAASFHLMTQEALARYVQGVKPEYIQILPAHGEAYSVDLRPDSPSDAAESPIARMAHFLPYRFLAKFSIRERQREEKVELLRYLFRGDLPSLPYPPSTRNQLEQLTNRHADNDLMMRLRELAEKHSVTTQPPTAIIGALLQWARQVHPSRREAFNREFQSLIREFLLSEMDTDDPEEGGMGLEFSRRQHTADILESAAQLVINFMTRFIRYLGPLRADPQEAQGFAPSSEPDDVGQTGAYAAAVYDANRRQRITWWNPETSAPATASLEVAMDTWVRYLGVAHQVSTTEAGLAGVSWQIRVIPDSHARPLPAVGVGISQVLPILVAGLLAPPGAVLLFEQPELHLHARAQARLGDFFLGLSRVGKQCIIETHSDYLVNQFRYHIVSGSCDTLDQIRMYFVRQDERGDSHFESVQISEHGNIVNWPDGFFDEALHQEDRITRASLLARAPKISDD
jgi:predicted ATPase